VVWPALAAALIAPAAACALRVDSVTTISASFCSARCSSARLRRAVESMLPLDIMPERDHDPPRSKLPRSRK
jgi:hypothetical protein